MKYHILILYSIMALSAFSQSIIPRVGLSISTIDMGEGFVGPDYETEYRTGIVAGAEGEYGFNERIGLAVSLLYSQKGWNGKAKFNTVDYKEEIRLDYLDLGIMPSVKVKPLYFMAGPVIGIGIGGRTERTEYYSNGPITNEGKPSFYHTFNFAGQLVLGVIIRKRAFVDIRYQKSFSNFFDAIDDTPSKLKSIQLTTGFLLGKGKFNN
jgi:hypothetical protein